MASAGTVAAALRALREARRLSMGEAARRADVSRASLHNWENGVHAPPGPALERLLHALRATPGERTAILAEAAPRHAQVVLAGEALGPPVGRGAILRAMRARRALTQGAVAQALGVTQGAVAKWESGDSVPNEETLRRLMHLLGATPEEAASLRNAGEPDGPLTLEEATANLSQIISPASFDRWGGIEPLLLAHEAEAWRRAVRDPRWEPGLVAAMSARTNWLDYAGRGAEGYALARQALRLATRCGAWDEAASAFNMTAYFSPDGYLPPERLERDLARAEAIASRMKDPQTQVYALGSWMALMAAEQRTPGGAEEAARRLEERVGPFGLPAELGRFSPYLLAACRIIVHCQGGRFDAAAEVEAAIPWATGPTGDLDVALNLANRMAAYLDHGVEPSADELSRYEAYAPTYAAIPRLRHMVRDWHRAYDARKRRRYV